jgi:hypothetical protein
VRLEGFGQLKNPVTSSGIEPAINIYLGERGCKNGTWFWILLNNGADFGISGVQNMSELCVDKLFRL